VVKNTNSSKKAKNILNAYKIKYTMIFYKNFDEVEKEISESTPAVIYKYRDWEEEKGYHKRIITERELYFAHPHTLNDPYDARPPYNFIVNDIDIESVRSKLENAGKYMFPNITEEELEHEVEAKIELIKQDPTNYFMKNRMDLVLDKSRYDNIGILSLCSSFDNEPMWAHYGNNYNGFAIGFNTVRLAEALKCAIGIVDYDDTPIDFHIMGDNSGIVEKELFRKSTKWKSEQEIRFLTLGVGLYRDRTTTFPVEVAEEIVFGLKTSKKTQDEIIEKANKIMPDIIFNKLVLKTNAYGFEKQRL
jgi:hypothetical protein